MSLPIVPSGVPMILLSYIPPPSFIHKANTLPNVANNTDGKTTKQQNRNKNKNNKKRHPKQAKTAGT